MAGKFDMDIDEDVPKRTQEKEVDPFAELAQSNPEQALAAYQNVISKPDPKNESLRSKEIAIYGLGKLLAKMGRATELKALLLSLRPLFVSLPKGKTAKIVRQLIDDVGAIPNTLQLQSELCKESIQWCIQEKRTFLKQRIQARLAKIYFEMGSYKDALKIISKLVKEVKKIDDKPLMVEIELTASRVHLALQNVAAAKGALTSARSNANAIYCTPSLQGEIDLQAGILCAEEHDYKTGFSYLYESFDSFQSVDRKPDALRALKYMLLCKIMMNNTSDVYSIINGKAGIKYAGVDVEAMKAVADAHKDRSIHAFEGVSAKYKAQLGDDNIIGSHLKELYDNLLEQNLTRLVEPFSRVQIPHVAKLINLPVRQVEEKLSEMILDKKLNGILDQGSGDLVIFEETPSDKTYEASLATVSEFSGVVDKLYKKAMKLRQ